VFADGATTRRAIAGSGHPLAPEELSTAPDDMDQVMTDANLDPAGMSGVAEHSVQNAVYTVVMVIVCLEHTIDDMDQVVTDANLDPAGMVGSEQCTRACACCVCNSRCNMSSRSS
jgi:hypothetical protein